MLHFLFSEISTVSWVFYFYKLTLGFNHQDLPRFLSQREDGIEVHPKWLHIWEIAPSTAYVDALHLQVHGFTLYNNKSHQRQTLTRTIMFFLSMLSLYCWLGWVLWEPMLTRHEFIQYMGRLLNIFWRFLNIFWRLLNILICCFRLNTLFYSGYEYLLCLQIRLQMRNYGYNYGYKKTNDNLRNWF